MRKMYSSKWNPYSKRVYVKQTQFLFNLSQKENH